MAKPKNKPHHRADTRGGGFTGLPHIVQDSAAYRDCSLWARAVLTEIIREFNGYNNGEIVLSVTQICDRLGNSNRGKAARAVAELMEHGLIDVATEAKWRQRLAREYRLTFVAHGKFPCIQHATNEYREWKPSEKITGNASLPVGDRAGNASSPDPLAAGNASSPDRFANLRKTAISERPVRMVAGNTASLHIIKPSQGPETGRVSTPENTPFSRRAKIGALEKPVAVPVQAGAA